MSNQKEPSQDPALLGCAVAVAPALVGCALGVLLGDRMGRKASQAAALTLFTVGVASAVPYVVDYVSKRVNGPATERGQKRTHQMIRDGIVAEEADFYELEEVVM